MRIWYIRQGLCLSKDGVTDINPIYKTAAPLRTPKRIAADQSERTTKLYDRLVDKITLDGLERIAT